MAPSLQSLRSHFAGRGLARPQHAKRSLFFGRDTNSTSPPSSQSVAAASLPTGTRALVGVVVFLTVIVLAFAAWRIYVYRQGKKTSRNSQHVGLYDAVEDRVKRSISVSSSGLTLPHPVVTRERTANEFKINLGYEAKVVYIAPQQNAQIEKPKNSPPAGLQISPPSYSFSDSKMVPVSPRTVASIAPKLPPVPSASARLPRLVVVESVFQATLHDELEIRVGEVLRLLEEYEDEWCLVQRVGPKDSEKGVVPRFCVVDKPATNPPTRRGTHVPKLSSSDIRI